MIVGCQRQVLDSQGRRSARKALLGTVCAIAIILFVVDAAFGPGASFIAAVVIGVLLGIWGS